MQRNLVVFKRRQAGVVAINPRVMSGVEIGDELCASPTSPAAHVQKMVVGQKPATDQELFLIQPQRPLAAVDPVMLFFE